MSKIIIDPSISNKDRIIADFSNYGWSAVSTMSETSSTRSNEIGWNFYISLKKGKRSVRINFYKGGKHISIYGLDTEPNKLGIENDKRANIVYIDLDIFDAYYKSLDEKHLKMLEGRRELKFKKQLCIPYVEGKLEENGFKVISHVELGPKSFTINFNSLIYDRSNNSITLKAVKYAEFLEDDFDNLIFELNFENLGMITGKLSKIVNIFKLYSESEKEVEQQLTQDRVEHKKLKEEIRKYNEILRPLESKLSIIGSRLGNKNTAIKNIIARKIKDESDNTQN